MKAMVLGQYFFNSIGKDDWRNSNETHPKLWMCIFLSKGQKWSKNVEPRKTWEDSSLNFQKNVVCFGKRLRRWNRSLTTWKKCFSHTLVPPVKALKVLFVGKLWWHKDEMFLKYFFHFHFLPAFLQPDVSCLSFLHRLAFTTGAC